MLLTYARWHDNLGFGALGMLSLYATLAVIGIAMDLIAGCVAVARGEFFAGRIALVSAGACVFAALVFVRLTVR